MSNRPVIDPKKRALVDQANKRAADAEQAALAAATSSAAAMDARDQAIKEADDIRQRELADEIEWDQVAAVANHDRHQLLCDTHNTELAKRRSVDGTHVIEIDPSSITKVTLDKQVHTVHEVSPLALGHRGYGVATRPGSRLTMVCGLHVDTPNDELAAARFSATAGAQGCATCATGAAPAKKHFNPPC